MAAQPFWHSPAMHTSPLPVHSPTFAPALPFASHVWISLPTHILPFLQASMFGNPLSGSVPPSVGTKLFVLLPQARRTKDTTATAPRARAYMVNP